MADKSNTTKFPTPEGAKLSPTGTAFSGFLGTTWPLIRAERDLSGFCGLGWDPAVDAWIRDAEAAHDATLAALKDVIGLSQITGMPARRKAVATTACRWFGVTMATASIRSGRAASATAISVNWA